MAKPKRKRWNPGNTKYTDKDRKIVIRYFKTHKENTDRNIAEKFGYDLSFVCNTLSKYWKDVQSKMNINRKNKMNEKLK